MLIVELLNKWVHLLSIAGVLGGTLFSLLVLAPQLKTDGDNAQIKAMWKRSGLTLAGLWVLVLITGFVNMYLISPTVNGNYQMWLGMKVALAMVMFIVTLLVSHPFPAVQKFFKERTPWLVVLLIIGVVIVGISAKLNISRVTGTGLKATGSIQATVPVIPAAPGSAP